MNIIGTSLEHFKALNPPIPSDSGISCPYRETGLCLPPAFQTPPPIAQVTLLYLLLADVEKFFCSVLPFLIITLLIVPVADTDILLKPCVLRRSVPRRLSYYLYTTPSCGTVRLARRGILRLELNHLETILCN